MRSKSTIINNKRTIAAVSITAIMAMVLMPFLVKPVMANNGEDAVTCDPEVVDDTSGKADYVYKLDSDCTLHIGPTNIPLKFDANGVIYPVKQHDKVRKIIIDNPNQTSLNSDSSHLFYGYDNVESIEGIEDLDTSNVENFSSMFTGLRNLKKPVNLSSWNVSSGRNFDYMFQDTNLDEFVGVNNFTFDFNKRPSPMINFIGMFADSTSTEGIDLSGWHFLNFNSNFNEISTDYMFSGAKAPKIDVSGLSGINIETTRLMFDTTNVVIEGINHLGKIEYTQSMFENTRPINQIDLSSWNTEKLYSADWMFKNSDIDKFSGMDSWNLQNLQHASDMYQNLNPSHPIRIQPNMPFVTDNSGMFSDSNIGMFPDITALQLPRSINARYMFKDAKETYLNISGWKNGKNINAEGMLASPYIKFMTFGDKTVGNDPSTNDFVASKNNLIFEGFSNINIWDNPNLPAEYSTKKWATLPIKPECDAKFDGDPNHLPKDCWDDSQSWVSDKTGKEADEELLDNTTKHYQRIFFRVEFVPVNFNANGVENVTDMPDMKYFLKVFTSNDDVIPNNIPEDPSGAKVFDSWNTQADGKGKTYHPGNHIGHDIKSIDLYAQWRSKAPKVQFDNNGGEGVTPETKPDTDDDTRIAVDCSNTPSRDGSTFIGWSKTKNDVLEGSEAGEKGKIDVCGYSGKKTITGLQGKTIDLYATWARKPKAVFNENRPKDMTALLPETKTITGDWHVDDSTPRTYVAPNIDGWYKGYTPDGVYQFDGWTNEDGSPFTGAYLEREDMTINAKWSKIKATDAPPEDNNHHTDDNEHDHDDNQDNKPSDDNDNSTSDSNSDNHGNNDNDNLNKDPVIEEKPSVPGNGASLGGIPSISNTSNNQMIDDSDSGDKPNIEDKGTTNSSNEDTAADSGRSDEDSQLAKTGIGMAIPVITIIVSMAAFIITRRLKRKA